MSEYEKQVCKLTKFKPELYADHQDYLAALVRYVDKWLYKHDAKGDLFAEWDDALCNWFDEAVHALNKGEHLLPDFPDREIADSAPAFEPLDEEDFSDESGDAETVPDPPKEPEAAAPGPVPEAAPTANPEPTEPPKPVPMEPATALIPAKRKKWEVKGPTRMPTPYDILTGDKDRYGVIVGTKTHDAILMYERGTSAKEILQALGGRHYNILNRLRREGHKVVKLPKHRFKVYHRDDVEKEKQEKAAAKAEAPITESGYDEDE